MMFAQRIQLNVLYQNDLACIRFEHRIVNDFVEVLPIALREKFQRPRSAIRGASQTFSIEKVCDAPRIALRGRWNFSRKAIGRTSTKSLTMRCSNRMQARSFW